MKNAFVHKIMNWIMANYPSMHQDKYDEIKYGIEVLYFGISKYLIILLIALILGCLKEALLCSLFFGIIRCTSFGLHSNNSFSCLMISSVVLLGIPYLSKIMYLTIWYKIIICIISIFIFAKYAPADTKNHPIVNNRIRYLLKTSAIFTAIVYSIVIVIFQNYISSMILLCMITECIIILPISYKIFNESYNNYLKYIT
ncbi:MAG: accessory gene regulator B family protein [Tissierellia bacterium]|nr:accessory gene regulator B family protein [Tissierellia bacterium]